MLAETKDNLVQMLTSAGAPFELIDVAVGGHAMRGFRRAETNLGVLLDNLALFRDREFIVDGDRRLTYGEVEAAAGRIARLLSDRGIGPGERVAIAMRNGPEWMVAFLAIIAIGAIPALVNSRGSASEMLATIDLVGARLTLVDERRDAMLGDATPCLVPQIDASAGGPALPRPSAGPDEAAMILFTSGTTGRSKGATLSHRAALTGLLLAQMAGAIIALRHFGPDALSAPRPQQTTLLAFPLFHVSGCHATFLSALASGGRLVVAARWEPEAIVRLTESERINSISGSPAMIWDLVHTKARLGAALDSLVSVSTGGQAQPINLLNAVVEAFPRAIVGTGFGSTETAGAVAMHTGADYLAHPRAAGRVLPLAEVRIVDANGIDQPVGSAGQILVRGPMVMSGFWNDPAATGRAIVDGWFHTGDVGALDELGNLTILDRLTDMVLCGGENIYCAEVEAALQHHPDIVEAAAYGLPHERLGERLVAIVRARDGAAVDPEQVRQSLSGRIADYKIPTEIFTTAEGLPRNALGKVDKRALRAAHA
jgi:long-chain acyl-CoA synthetase